MISNRQEWYVIYYNPNGVLECENRHYMTDSLKAIVVVVLNSRPLLIINVSMVI